MNLNEMTKTTLRQNGYSEKIIRKTEEYLEPFKKGDFIIPQQFAYVLGYNTDNEADFERAFLFLFKMVEAGYIMPAYYQRCPHCGEVGTRLFTDPEPQRGKLTCEFCGKENSVDNNLFLIYCVV